MATYETSGTLTTATKTADYAANEAEFTVTVPTNTQINVTIYQDTTGDGTANNTDSITDISSSTYSLTGFEAVTGADYWIEFSLSTTDDTTTPVVDISTVSGTLFFTGAAALDGTGDMVPTASVSRPAAASLDGTGDVVGSSTQTRIENAVLTGSGDLYALKTTAGVKAVLAALDGTGDVVGSSTQTRNENAALTGSGDLIAPSGLTGAATLDGSGDLSGSRTLVVTGNSTLDGSGDVVATGLIVIGVGSVLVTTTGNALSTTTGVINTK